MAEQNAALRDEQTEWHRIAGEQIDALKAERYADDCAALERYALYDAEIAALKAERDAVVEDSKAGLACALKEIDELKAEVELLHTHLTEEQTACQSLAVEVERLTSLLRMTTQDSIDGRDADHEEAERLRALLRPAFRVLDEATQIDCPRGLTDEAMHAWFAMRDETTDALRAALGEG